MRKFVVLSGFLLFSHAATAQWAVLDEEVRKLVEKINNVTSSSGRTLSAFDAQALLSDKFETMMTSNPERYVGTVADCGDNMLNQAHYNACLGLRNLRLKTLDQTEAIITKIKTRRDEIKAAIQAGDAAVDAGNLQRFQFQLQGLQTHLQNDAMELEALRYGYRQREKMYEVQMAESRRATDTRPPSATGGVSLNLGPVKFR